MEPLNTEEKIAWYAIVGIYPFYFLGALYLIGPIVGWLFFTLFLTRFFSQKKSIYSGLNISWLQVLWCIAMFIMLVALIKGHLDFNIASLQIFKSTIGWFKGWALLAVFILVGSLSIRPALIVRACMRVCTHSLILIPLLVLAWLLNLPATAYVSPLQVIGGPGPEFFAVSLYEIDPGSGLPRWRIFTPWAPALGFVANIFFLLALQEKDKFYRLAGLVASILMILMSQSRLALLSVILLTLLNFHLRYFTLSRMMFLAAVFLTFLALFMEPVIDFLNNLIETFYAARADSTRVRHLLADIAIQRWRDEAIIWGHGVVEPGPHLVEYMLIGSHHTWYGLLFVKGIVGFFALALPLIASSISLMSKAVTSDLNRSAFCHSCLIIFFSFGENLEILAYVIWPSLLWIGLAHSSNVKGEKP